MAWKPQENVSGVWECVRRQELEAQKQVGKSKQVKEEGAGLIVNDEICRPPEATYVSDARRQEKKTALTMSKRGLLFCPPLATEALGRWGTPSIPAKSADANFAGSFASSSPLSFEDARASAAADACITPSMDCRRDRAEANGSLSS